MASAQASEMSDEIRNDTTDWDSYYSKPSRLASITRKITRRRLTRRLHEFLHKKEMSICEYGGGNSFIAKTICKEISVSYYHVIDTNQVGLSLLAEQSLNSRLGCQLGDVLDPTEQGAASFDLVFSVGLIEHFDEQNTGWAIQSHFRILPL